MDFGRKSTWRGAQQFSGGREERKSFLNRMPVLSCILGFIVAVMLFACLPQRSFAVDFEEEINRLCNLPEDKIDIAIVSLTLAKEINPELDVEAYSAKVDEMVQGTRALTKGSTDPDYRVRALNTYLFKKRGIEYDLSDPQAQKPENRYLNGMLDTKKGSCITMPVFILLLPKGWDILSIRLLSRGMLSSGMWILL